MKIKSYRSYLHSNPVLAVVFYFLVILFFSMKIAGYRIALGDDVVTGWDAFKITLLEIGSILVLLGNFGISYGSYKRYLMKVSEPRRTVPFNKNRSEK